MTVDLTPGPRRLGENEMEPSRRAAYDAVNELIRQDPEARMWRAVAVALAVALPIERRAGREDEAKAIEAIPEHPEMVPNAAEEWQNGFRWGWHYAVKAVREAIDQGQQQREGA